jgi:hypothetical protein
MLALVERARSINQRTHSSSHPPTHTQNRKRIRSASACAQLKIFPSTSSSSPLFQLCFFSRLKTFYKCNFTSTILQVQFYNLARSTTEQMVVLVIIKDRWRAWLPMSMWKIRPKDSPTPCCKKHTWHFLWKKEGKNALATLRSGHRIRLRLKRPGFNSRQGKMFLGKT